jgi:hypothetical protein
MRKTGMPDRSYLHIIVGLHPISRGQVLATGDVSTFKIVKPKEEAWREIR